MADNERAKKREGPKKPEEIETIMEPIRRLLGVLADPDSISQYCKSISFSEISWVGLCKAIVLENDPVELWHQGLTDITNEEIKRWSDNYFASTPEEVQSNGLLAVKSIVEALKGALGELIKDREEEMRMHAAYYESH